MASNKRTIYLGLDYTEFTGGISEVNRKMGLLDAEFKLAQEQAKNYGNETDRLGIKHDLLSQKLVLQKQKVELAKKAFDEALSTNKATQKEIDSLDKKLLQERTALEKLNGQLQQSKDDMDNMNKSTETFGDAIRGVASDLGLNVSPAIEKLASKFDGVNKSVGNAIIGIGAIVGAFVSCSIGAANFADDILTLSSVTGIATDELQKMQYASDFLDVSMETMTGGITRLTRSMDDARNGNKELAEGFKRLRVSITDSHGQLKDANQVFYDTIDALGRVKNETERDALAMTLLGKSAKELNPLIEAGSKRLKELGVEAENMGTVMGEDSLEKLGKFKDTMDKLENTTGALKNSLGLALLPILTALFTVISNIPVPVLQTLVVLASVIATVMMVVKAIKSLTDTGKTIKDFFGGFNAQTFKTTAIILGVVAALIALGTIIAVIAGKGNQINSAMASIGDNVGKVSGTINEAQMNTRNVANNAIGTDNFSGGYTWINEGKPELVKFPRGTQIVDGESSEKLVGGDNYYVTVEVKANEIQEVQDFINILKGQRMAKRRV